MRITKSRPKNTLDNTLRYLYSALRNRGCALVALRFKHGGRTWEADTIEEAIALRKRLEAEDAEHVVFGEPDSSQEHVWTPDVLMELLENLGDYQKLFLRMLFEKKQATSEEVIKKLGLDSEMSFAGVLSGLSKQLKKQNLAPWDLYMVETKWTREGKTRTFRLTNHFRSESEELGWPEDWK